MQKLLKKVCCFCLFSACKYKRIYLEDVCIIEAYKFNDRNYSIKAFSYKDKNIFCRDQLNLKKKLIEQIEVLLKGHVYPYFEAR